MTSPQVDVVLPIYNAQDYLELAIRSLLDQSFTSFRAICVDDGSTDNTPAILDQLQQEDARIDVVRQENRGLVGALNRGLEHATAPLIARMDADDIALPDRFARQVEFLNQHPDVVALGTAILEMDSDGDPLGISRLPETHDAIESGMLQLRMGLAHPSVMMRRNAVEAVGGYRSEFEWVEDIDLWLRLAERGHLANLPDVLLCYRQHSVSGTWSVGRVRRERTSEVIRQAYARRGQTVPASVISQCENQRSPAGPHKWARKASRSGLFRIAAKHACQQWVRAPLKPLTWRMTLEVLARSTASLMSSPKERLPEIPRKAA